MSLLKRCPPNCGESNWKKKKNQKKKTSKSCWKYNRKCRKRSAW